MQVDNMIAGSDVDGKAAVIELIQSIGMRPIDAGPRSWARIIEAMRSLNIYLNTPGRPWQNAWKLIEPSRLRRGPPVAMLFEASHAGLPQFRARQAHQFFHEGVHEMRTGIGALASRAAVLPRIALLAPRPRRPTTTS
jgi:hypothetical protein